MTEQSIFLRNPSYLDAIVGCTEEGSVCYSFQRMIAWLMKEDNFTYEEAVEFIDYNTVRAIPYMESAGSAPTIIYDLEEDPDLQDEIDRIRKEDAGE